MKNAQEPCQNVLSSSECDSSTECHWQGTLVTACSPIYLGNIRSGKVFIQASPMPLCKKTLIYGRSPLRAILWTANDAFLRGNRCGRHDCKQVADDMTEEEDVQA